MANLINETQTTTTPTKKSRETQTIDSKLGRASEMLAGLTAHVEEMKKRGIDEAFLIKLNTYYQNSLDAHNAQLSFKARMMEKAREAKNFLTQVQALYSEARKQVKMTLAKETWREFGIMDQR